MAWYLEKEFLQLREPEEPQELQQEVHFVRAVEENFFQESPLHRRIEIILDSGADASLMPKWLGQEPLRSIVTALQAAQGKRIRTEGGRIMNMTFFDLSGDSCQVQEAFTVVEVINPLMAVGKLCREGWELLAEEGLVLTDGSSRIPVHLRKNSLAANAYIQSPTKASYKEVNFDMVRTAVLLNQHLQEAIDKNETGWRNTDSMVIVKHGAQNKFENLSLMFKREQFPSRSTLVKDAEGWRAIEVSNKYSQRTEPLEEIGEGAKETATAISPKAFLVVDSWYPC